MTPPTTHAISVSISMDFLKAYARIPASQQRRVREFAQLFQANPTSPGIHYESIRGAADPNLKSARIDKDYRAVIASPQAGNVYILLWVDKHEDAYRWAERKRLLVNPHTGSLQLMQVDDLQPPPTPAALPDQPPPTTPAALFDHLSDEQLLTLGIPAPCLPQVRAIRSEDDLCNQEDKLPQDAYQALFMLACGQDYQELLDELDRHPQPTAPIDTANFQVALAQDDSQAHFASIEDAMTLEAMLNAPLEQWRTFLHPQQRKLVSQDASGPVRVTGEAGTGKTVVAMHRALWLAQHVLQNDHDRILFTTFTKNLALDIRSNLAKICPVELLRRIDVIHLDAWTFNFLRKNNYPVRLIDFDDHRRNELWENAIHLAPTDSSLPRKFYQDEWEQVVQPQRITSLQQYYRASRAGRGRRLDRVQRMKVWPILEEYRAQLDEHGFREREDMFADVTAILRQKGLHPYRAILVDEAQDFSEAAFAMLRAMAPETRNDLFIVGDAHQRIYGRKASLAKAGIRVTGRSRRLKTNYRTTRQTYHFAKAILAGLDFDNLDGAPEKDEPCHSLTSGPKPQLLIAPDEDGELTAIVAHLRALIDTHHAAPESICLTAYSHELCDHYADALAQHGFQTCIIQTDAEMDTAAPGIRIATMHRVKGIEFDHILIASACRDQLPPPHLLQGCDTPLDQERLRKQLRSLLYVAVTRARKTVLITGHGAPSELLPTQA
ncbi:MAG: UvrD-helicase domain-containing protein [Oligosphaeraceae bacterium]